MRGRGCAAGHRGDRRLRGPRLGALHRACGFADACRLARVGYKHGRWLDTLLLQRDLYLQPGAFPGCFASGLPAAQAAGLAATQRPLADSATTGKSGRPAWKAIPSWAVVGTSDKVIPPAELTAMARHADAHITDVPAGHLSLISDPAAVTRIIIEAAVATG